MVVVVRGDFHFYHADFLDSDVGREVSSGAKTHGYFHALDPPLDGCIPTAGRDKDDRNREREIQIW